MYKIYRKGDYLVINTTVRNEFFYGHIREVFIDKSNVDKNIYRFFNVKDFDENLSIKLEYIQKENGASYSQYEWETFYTELSLFRGVPITITGTVNTGLTQGLTDTQLRATPVPISPRANTSGINGTTPYKLISTASTNANVIKNTGGNLYSIIAIGLTSTVRYLKLYNKSTTPSVGTDVPIMTIPIPANTQGAGISIPFSMGINFSNGIGIAITSGSADNDTGVIGAGDVIVNFSYA